MSSSETQLQRLRRLDACTVSDALDTLKLPGVVSGLPRRSGSGVIAGRAITLKVGLGEPPSGPTRHLGTRAIELAGTDHIVVIEQRSGVEAGCWGGILTLGARLRGVAGVIADGPVRDIDEAIEAGFPIFSRTVTARTARGRLVELSTNLPIMLGDIEVRPDDYLIADASAVVVIAAAHIDVVLDNADAIVRRETDIVRALREGCPISNAMAGNYESMLKGTP